MIRRPSNRRIIRGGELISNNLRYITCADPIYIGYTDGLLLLCHNSPTIIEPLATRQAG